MALCGDAGRPRPPIQQALGRLACCAAACPRAHHAARAQPSPLCSALHAGFRSAHSLSQPRAVGGVLHGAASATSNLPFPNATYECMHACMWVLPGCTPCPVHALPSATCSAPHARPCPAVQAPRWRGWVRTTHTRAWCPTSATARTPTTCSAVSRTRRASISCEPQARPRLLTRARVHGSSPTHTHMHTRSLGFYISWGLQRPVEDILLAPCLHAWCLATQAHTRMHACVCALWHACRYYLQQLVGGSAAFEPFLAAYVQEFR